MASNELKILRERLTSRVIIATLITAALAFLCLYASETWLLNHSPWSGIVDEVGSALLVSVALSALWELAGKRAFADEVLAKASMSRDVSDAGLTAVMPSFQSEGIKWTTLFKAVRSLDIYFSYASTWRINNLASLQKLAKRKARVRVVLPDPEDGQTVNELARRFQQTPDKIREKISESATFFTDLVKQNGKKGAKISVYFMPCAPLFSMYRFDQTAIIALYNHRRDRVPVPTFVCDQDGFLYKFLSEEFEAMVKEGGMARLADA